MVPEATTPFEVGIAESHFLPRNLRGAPEGQSTLVLATVKQKEFTGGDAVQEDQRVEDVTPSIVLTSAEPLNTQERTSQYETRTSVTALESGTMMDTQRTDSPSSAIVSNTSRPEKSKFLESIRVGIKQLMSSAGPSFTKQLLQADISPECTFGLFNFMRALQALEPWALRLIDATAKYPTGFLQVNMAEVGAYDECIETVVRDDNGFEKVRGQFCNMHVQLGDDVSFIDEILPALAFSHERVEHFKGYLTDKKLTGLRLGVCVIDSCSEQDITNIAHSLLGSFATINVKNCVTSVDEGIDNTQAWIIAILAVIATVIVAATSFELLTRNWDKERKNSTRYKCLVAFSLITNTRIIVDVSNNQNSDGNSLRFIHGIRFLSIFWVCLGHSYGTIADNITRLVNALHYFEHWESLIAIAGFLAVDTFFFLSGFLLYYALMKQTRNRVVVTLVAIIRRFIRNASKILATKTICMTSSNRHGKSLNIKALTARLRTTVPLFFVIMCMHLLPLIASGPNSKELYNKFYAEIRKHWWDFLFHMRNWRGDQEITILVQVWYLAADFQFFLISLVVIQTFRPRKWLTAATFALLSLVSCSISAWQIYGTNLRPFVVAVADTFRYTGLCSDCVQPADEAFSAFPWAWRYPFIAPEMNFCVTEVIL
ncbi:nose resistant to fluoxetine protein 6-like [Dermacentor variabilis]|uniref:nose resistant to fluoxetine protein 6-like n=1 Tax=Dermacentor variabilis TaxID=34621 RepID=UPI003F5C4394